VKEKICTFKNLGLDDRIKSVNIEYGKLEETYLKGRALNGWWTNLGGRRL